jgi:hypothetical protein
MKPVIIQLSPAEVRSLLREIDGIKVTRARTLMAASKLEKALAAHTAELAEAKV